MKPGVFLSGWRTHSCVQRPHSWGRSWLTAEHRHECRCGTQECVRHVVQCGPCPSVAQSDSLAVPEYRLTSGCLRLISALLDAGMPLPKRVEKSLDRAGRSACATKKGSSQIPRPQGLGDSLRPAWQHA